MALQFSYTLKRLFLPNWNNIVGISLSYKHLLVLLQAHNVANLAVGLNLLFHHKCQNIPTLQLFVITPTTSVQSVSIWIIPTNSSYCSLMCMFFLPQFSFSDVKNCYLIIISTTTKLTVLMRINFNVTNSLLVTFPILYCLSTSSINQFYFLIFATSNKNRRTLIVNTCYSFLMELIVKINFLCLYVIKSQISIILTQRHAMIVRIIFKDSDVQ